ncbi:MAG: response regulator transcription factor, partial [Dehalococcoidales bacterium]|nr:response regulator transcription factor [Dehalococcoidales bacterium]
MEKTRVLLSDPQVLFREGIHFVLSGEEDIEVAGETTDNEEAFALIDANPPHIVLLSLEDKKTGGLEIARRIRRTQPSVAIILTLSQKDEESIFRAMKSGVSACLTRDSSPEELVEVIRAVLGGELPVIEELTAPKMAATVLEEFRNLEAMGRQMENVFCPLSPRESQILSGLAAGESLSQVAGKIGTDENSLRRHLKNVLHKLTTNDQAQAIVE